MAESQVSFTYLNDGNDIIDSLSKQRFFTYLKKSSFKKNYAFDLYLYNSRLSKSLLFPLQVFEVCLRNAINNFFIKEFCIDWAIDSNFRKILNSHSLATLDKAIERAKSSSNDDIIAVITLDFWSNLFRSDYDRSLWQKNIHNVFGEKVTRKLIQKDVAEINKLRNRIAHHEPILDLNLNLVYKKIIELIKLISKDTAKWTNHFTTFHDVIRTKPSVSGGQKPLFSEKYDSDFCIVDENTFLSELPKNRFLICKRKDIEFICEKSDIALYIYDSAKDNNEIIVDLKTIKLSTIIQLDEKSNKNFHLCSGTESFRTSNILFNKKYIDFILVQDKKGILGVIKKPHII